MDIWYVHAPLNRLNTVDYLNHGIEIWQIANT